MAQGEGGGKWKQWAAAAAAAIGMGQASEAPAQTRAPITGSVERGDEAQQEGVTITRLGQYPFVERSAGNRRGEAIRRSQEAFQSLTSAGFPADLVDDAVALVAQPPNFRDTHVRFMNPSQLGTDETFDGMVSRGGALVESASGGNFVRLNTEQRPGGELGVERWVLQGPGNTAYVLSLLEVCMNWSFKRITLDEVAPARTPDEFGPCSPVEMSDMPEGTEGVMTQVVLVPAGDLSPREEAIFRTCLGRSISEGALSPFDCIDGRCNYQEQAMALVLQQIRDTDRPTFERIRRGELSLRAFRPFAFTADAQGQANYYRPRQVETGAVAEGLTEARIWDIFCFTAPVGDRSFRSNMLSLNELEDDGVTVRPVGEAIDISLTDRVNERVTTFYRISNVRGPGPGDDVIDGRQQYRWTGSTMRREQ